MIYNYFNSYEFLLAVEIIACSIKAYLLIMLILNGMHSPKKQWPWIFIISVLINGIFEDVVWMINILKILEYIKFDYRIWVFFVRFAWISEIIEYQSLVLFIESLVRKEFRVSLLQKVFLTISVLLALPLIYLSFISSFFTYTPLDRSPIEIKFIKLVSMYPYTMVIPTLILAFYKLKNSRLPKLVMTHFKILVFGLIIPRVLSDFYQVYQFATTESLKANYFVVSLSTLLISCAAYYCMKKIMRLRFLNFKPHVQSSKKFRFINNFKYTLEQLSYVSNTQELLHITKVFFKEHLHITASRTTFHIRNIDSNDLNINNFSSEIDKHKILLVESFINSSDHVVVELLKKSKVFIVDEIEFNAFYKDNQTNQFILDFLRSINTELFVPIYKNNIIIAYILVEHDSRSQQIYSDLERDEIVIFSSYLGNIINLIQNRNLNFLIQQEKDLKEEVYNKHQEISQYKESIRSFLKVNKNEKIGIMFYKNRKFLFGNKHAEELISVNVNTQDGYIITQDLKNIVQQVEEYKSQQTCYSRDTEGEGIIITGIPNIDNSVIIVVYKPDVTDTIKKQLSLLKDPSKWDYLLYLETTKSGQLINQLIPSSGEIFLNYKLDLLKVALTKKPILLEIPDEDLIPTVEIIHHISLREKLHVLKLQTPTKNFDITVKLFGLNPLFDQKDIQTPILQKLDDSGTLFIQNIHFLDLEMQECITELIQYGYYKIFKSDKKVASDVRIICSTNQNLKNLVQEKKFSKTLYDILTKNAVSMPSLLTISEEELGELAHGYSQQAIKSDQFKNLLELTNKEKINLINKKPISLLEFKEKVQQILTDKSKKNNIYEETQFDLSYNVSDPRLVEAARLGKYALKDPRIITLLWDKFKNQNKIAVFLGVNRSSVHRRCKELNLK